MSKKVGRPPKISGADKNFWDRPHFSRGRIWKKIKHCGLSKLSKYPPIERADGCPRKDCFKCLLGWDRSLDEK